MTTAARLAAAACTAATVLAALLPTSAGAAAEEGVGAARTHAERVLVEARGVLAGTPSGREATLVLRDLALSTADLPAGKRAEARRLLARPTDGVLDPGQDGYGPFARPTSRCSAVVCVHWTTGALSPDTPDLTDDSGNGVPDYVDRVLATVTSVHQSYVRAGYRAPKPDGSLGGNAKPDVYLADIGDRGLYGYCTTDQDIPQDGPFDAWAYCVLDNDYTEFRANTPLENLRVTAAHEYFHAVQFGYDAAEDRWFMEATAAWVEDELFDSVDDNVQYLEASPLSDPQLPADTGAGIRVYGSWVWFRHLAERFPEQQGGLPTVVRDMWRLADSRRGAPDHHSLEAVARTLEKRGTTLPAAFGRFAAANLRSRTTYDEGRANRYPVARPADSLVLSSSRRAATRRTRIDHLASASLRVRPGAGLGAGGWRLRVAVDLPAKRLGSAAVVTVVPARGRASVTTVRLDAGGRGSVSVPFSGRKVRHVDVTLVNASRRYLCWQGEPYSCQGVSVDDDAPAKVSVRARR